MRHILLTLTLLIIPTLTYAQAPPTTGLQVVISGGVSPVTNVLPIAAVTCGQPPQTAPSGTTHNATRFSYIDPTDATKSCVYTDPGNGPLLSLPFGGTVYTATVAFVNTLGAGPVSNISNPFDHPGTVPTTAPGSLKVLP